MGTVPLPLTSVNSTAFQSDRTAQLETNIVQFGGKAGFGGETTVCLPGALDLLPGLFPLESVHGGGFRSTTHPPVNGSCLKPQGQ